MRLTQELAEEIGQSVRRELEMQVVKEGLVTTCDRLILSFANEVTPSDPKHLLAQVFRIIWFLESATPKVKATHKTCADLTRIAEYSLNILGVRPYKSKLSFLYRSLYDARAQFFSNLRDAWHSVWSLQVGDAMDGTESARSDDEQRKMLEIEATQYLRCGFIADAVALFQKAESLAKDDREAWQIRLNTVRCLRILNEVNLALEVIATLQHQTLMPEDLKASVAWETAMLTAQRDRDITAVIQRIEEVMKNPQQIHLEYMPLAVLWCYASKQRSVIDRMPSAAWLKARISGIKDGKNDAFPLKLIGHLEDFYFQDLSIFNKLKHVGEVLGELRVEPASAELALFFAAAARWLLRSKQRRTAALAINIYQSISLTISNGRTASSFELLDDIGDSLNASAESSRVVTLTQGVKAGFERTLLYIEIVTKLFALAIVAKIKNFNFDSEVQAYRRSVLIKLSEFFVKYASGAMKGPIHKLGQVVLNFLDLPEEAQQNFKLVLWSKTVVDANVMRRVLEEDLQQKTDDVFAEFDWNPVGVGSVSQVYRAKLKTGEDVAVKIQYPDLAKIVKQDLDVFRRILPTLRWLFPRNDLPAIGKFLFDLYQRETNFLNELEAAKILGGIIERGARWRIPQFFADLCSQRVLVSEFVPGMNFYEFSETASTSEKLEVSKAIHQFLMLAVIEGHMIYLDPHPANIIVSDDAIVMIDFGCFARVSPEFSEISRQIMLSYLQVFDAEKLIDRQLEIYRQGEVIGSHPDVDEKDIREFLDLLIQQLNWEDCSRPGLWDRLSELYLKQGVNKVFGSKEPEFSISFVSVLLMIRTINKFGVPHSQSTSLDNAKDLLSRRPLADESDYSQAG